MESYITQSGVFIGGPQGLASASVAFARAAGLEMMSINDGSPLAPSRGTMQSKLIPRTGHPGRDNAQIKRASESCGDG